MRLAKLTLSGFKSFADRTEFTFDEAVTGVVGPNGCGKSNIVDSIKWVLGERSSKSLRGKEMIDVIFAGSAGRKPSGMASVVLTFENPILDAEAELFDLQIGGEHTGNDDRGGEAHSEPAEVEANPPAGQRKPARRKRRGLPIEADVVEVERRLYRDGTSKYIINGKAARLKDIRDLFLDTGIGADAYSIIEQGKVDAMLLASPQERRHIFEEAAGIARYKQRRIESQRKLDKAQANLALTREQLANTERRLRIVKGQAVKARRFKELDSELRAWRLALAFDQYDDIRQRLDGLTSRISELEAVRTEATSRLAEIEAAKQEAELARHELLKEHKQLEEQRLAAQHAEQSAAQRKAMTERALEDARRQMESDAQRLKELQTRLADLESAAEDQSQIIASVSEKLAETEREATRIAQHRADVLQQQAEKQGILSERRAAAANIDRERAGLLASLEADRQREQSLHDQLHKLQERAEALTSEDQRLQSARGEAATQVETRQAAIDELESALSARDQAADSLSKGRGELSQRVSSLEQHVLRIDSRRMTLQEMVESRVGLGEAVRQVLDARDAQQAFADIIAPLADLIDADGTHAGAVEAALGMNLQALVVPSVAAMPGSSELASLSGRVTFLPLAGLHREPQRDHRAGEPLNAESAAHIGISEFEGGAQFLPTGAEPADAAPLGDLIRSGRLLRLDTVVRLRSNAGLAERETGRTKDLIERLLANTWLVDDLDSAMMLAAVLPEARFVTRDGHVMDADGRVQAGPLAGSGEEPAGMLQRRSELAELESQLVRLSESLDDERGQLQAVDAEAAAVAASQTELRSRLAAEQRALVADRAKLEQLSSQIERLGRDRTHVDEEVQQLRDRLAKVEEDRVRLKDRIQRLAGLHQEQVELAAALDEELREIARQAEAHQEQITALRVESSRLGEQLGAARREHRRLESAGEAAQREQRDLSGLLEQSQGRLAEHQRAIEEAASQIEASRAEVRRLQQEVESVSARMHSANERAHQLGEDVGTARQHAQHVERDWHSLEVARRELEVKRESLEDRSAQDLELDLACEYPEYRGMMSAGDVARIDQTDAATVIDELRREIRKLGNVNLEAIEEESQLESRNEELIRQVADIDEATRKLTDLIQTLNTASRERFGEVFKTIQEHFAGSGGMFRKLFGGGRAELRLMPLIKEVETPEGVKKVETDEVDLLESGIEVIAKPPGKEPRSISQLSGGEKTLTAVALLLAIFRSRPSCFCILDEVDAALDDSNVGRYCTVVREFTTHSHFIVITHNKKTMQAADRLYGVTMQERGVSTRVSVKFDQVGNNGEIAPKPARRDEPDALDVEQNQAQTPAAASEPEPVATVASVHINGEIRVDDVANGHNAASERKSDLLRRALAGMRDAEHPVETTADTDE